MARSNAVKRVSERQLLVKTGNEAQGYPLEVEDGQNLTAVEQVDEAIGLVGRAPPGRLISRRERWLTKAFAEHYLSLEASRVRRAVDTRYAHKLVRLAVQGRLWPGPLQLVIARCDWDGQDRQLDGQHVCRMRLCLSDKPHPRVIVLRIAVATPDEFRKLSASFEASSWCPSRITARDELFDKPQFAGVSSQTLNGLVGGWKFWCRLSRGKFRIGEVCDQLLLPGNLSLARLATNCIDHLIYCRTKSIFCKAPVFAAVLATCHKHGERAEEFWRRLGSGRHNGNDDPIAVLHNFLSRYSGGVSHFSSEERTAFELQRYNTTIVCYGKYMCGERVAGSWRPPLDRNRYIELD